MVCVLMCVYGGVEKAPQQSAYQDCLLLQYYTEHVY